MKKRPTRQTDRLLLSRPLEEWERLSSCLRGCLWETISCLTVEAQRNLFNLKFIPFEFLLRICWHKENVGVWQLSQLTLSGLVISEQIVSMSQIRKWTIMLSGNTQGSMNLQGKFGHFRILIVRKPRDLQQEWKKDMDLDMYVIVICAKVYDQVDPLQVEGSMGHGIHNVENELIFRSNDKLVFHDSQGFEAGSEVEFLQMKKFIAGRAKTLTLKKHIHAIWYCIPMDKLD
ncbi:hypothetical protein OG21DRAFT_1527565 [Imleria badia]|nr:hypothetical protein OG21DRAFT_1527565 [Imleria badia]